MNISFGNEDFVKKSLCFREEGALLLRFNSSYTVFSGAEKYNTLYEMMSSNCEEWVSSVLVERVRREFLASDDLYKKFRFPAYEYSFSSYIAGEDADKLCVITDVSLSRRGSPAPIEFKRSSQLWRKSDLAIMPDSFLLPRKRTPHLKALLKRKPTGFFLRQSSVFAFGSLPSGYWEERLV